MSRSKMFRVYSTAIKLALWKKGITQKELARKIGITPTAISKAIRSGRMSMHVLYGVAKALDLEPAELLDLEPGDLTEVPEIWHGCLKS